MHDRPWGSVWRLRHAGGVAWLKACRPGQAFEVPLTAGLAGRWPDRLPDVLGHDERRAWLLLGDAGERLGFGGVLDPWLAILPRYAELQRGEAGRVAEHLAAGVPDRRLGAFPALYDAMLGSDPPWPAEARERLGAFAPRFAELCAELAARGVPETVDHADLHGNNVYVHGASARVLDWGDACVSHPFLTAWVTFLHVEELDGVPPDDPWFGRLRDAYLEPWGKPSEHRETFALAQRLGAFAHLFKELRVAAAIPPAERPRFVAGLPGVVARCVASTSAGAGA